MGITAVIAENVASHREARGWSQRQLAAIAGVGSNSVRHLEQPEARAPTARGSNAPRLDVVAKVAEALGLSPWMLLVPSLSPAFPLAHEVPTLQELSALRRLRASVSEALEGLEK